MPANQPVHYHKRVLSGWNPKDGARHPSLRALEEPNLSRALKLQALLFRGTTNHGKELAEVLTATLVMHYPDMLLLADRSAFIGRMRESLAALAIGEAELLARSVAIRRVFTLYFAQFTIGCNAKIKNN
ncbi:Hypothetical protein PHPALM_2631 [Phytophthora palmivora]|uniref:Uncharacterized protein n=1 Tax=Phytophthora palmivora TaxID=4796 RepID=A0A2P4YPA3_9STRA|nr:Hypothetical protein PHPALM_2631 [Phytophthora palmivora]